MPETQAAVPLAVLVRALFAAEEFARKNFPQDGRLKHITVYEDEPGTTIVVGGGSSPDGLTIARVSKGRVYEPGMYLVFDEASWYGSGAIYDRRILGGKHLLECQIDHEKLVATLRKFLDF